jgi:hypothetical protein
MAVAAVLAAWQVHFELAGTLAAVAEARLAGEARVL